ncbi:MAG: hypothetical protein ACT4N2_07290 [Hyphomicrobium sp.]
MASVADPNWLEVASSFLTLSGAGFLGKAWLNTGQPEASEPVRRRAETQRCLDQSIGIPLVASGLLAHATAQLASVPLNTGIAILMLTLAFGLFLYLVMEDLWVDALMQKADGKASQPAKLALPPPTAPSPAPAPVAIEHHEGANPRLAVAARSG